MSAFRNDWYRVDRVTYKRPDGKSQEFHVREQDDSVSVLALTRDNHAILAGQFRPGPGRYLFELPGGKLDAGESLAQAAARELLEETGYQGDITAVGSYYVDGYSTTVRHAFLASNCTKVAVQRLDENEVITVEVVTMQRLHKIAFSGQMTDTTSAIYALTAARLLDMNCARGIIRPDTPGLDGRSITP